MVPGLFFANMNPPLKLERRPYRKISRKGISIIGKCIGVVYQNQIASKRNNTCYIMIVEVSLSIDVNQVFHIDILICSIYIGKYMIVKD